MNQIETEFLGEKITYVYHLNKWRCDKLDILGESLAAVEDKIKQFKKKTFQPVQAIEISWHNATPVTITSVSDDGKEYWVKNNETNRRSKIKADELVPATPHNLAILGQIQDCIQRDYALHAQQDALRKSLQPGKISLKAVPQPSETPKV